MRRGFDPDDAPKALSMEQKITAAWAYHVRGIDQHTIAALFGVNAGRVAEACKKVERALEEREARADAVPGS